MPGLKKKTHKGMAKRFKLTGSGKKLKRKIGRASCRERV